MQIVNVNIENRHGVSVVTFLGEGGEAIEVRLAPDHAGADDAATVAKARALLAQVARFGDPADPECGATSESAGPRSQQDFWSGAGHVRVASHDEGR